MFYENGEIGTRLPYRLTKAPRDLDPVVAGRSPSRMDCTRPWLPPTTIAYPASLHSAVKPARSWQSSRSQSPRAQYTFMRDLDHDAPDNGGRARCALPIGARRRCRGFVDPAGRRLSFDDPPRISP
jgi:hypothetical protein